MRKLLLITVTMVAVLAAGSAAPAFADEEDCTTSTAALSGICWNAGVTPPG